MGVKPEIVKENGKIAIKIALPLDTDGDGVASAKASLVIEVDEAEAAQEILKKLKLPDWIANLLPKA